MWIITAVKFVFDKLASSAADAAVSKGRKYLLSIPIPGRRRLHFSELRSKISKMPFIYKDFSSEVLTDFVDIDMTALDPSMMRRPDQPFEMDYGQRIRNRKRVVIFGSGGIGKTTYVRRSILEVIAAKGKSRLFNEKEYLIPFYVPLKAIDTSDEFPILNHLLNNNSYLAGTNGIKRLASLALHSKLLLCLDGYDEIPFPSGEVSKNYVLGEIALLTGEDAGGDPSFPTLYHESFYKHIRTCRVWISSRLEFYQYNKFPVDRSALAVELVGVPARNRAKLVKNIFSRYEDRLRTSGIDINHEQFIQRIERSDREELVNLSFNPLFLTVMAYIYVNRVIATGTYDVALVKNIINLVDECVNLLLIDLDEGRARGLSAAQREAVLCRRNEWVEEKRAFLGYFALRLILDAHPTFNSDYIRKCALAYFQNNNEFSDSVRIVKSITGNSVLPSFVDQLIFCGIFVQVERGEHGTLYDFPHRKFREVLAAQHLDKQPDYFETLEYFVDHPELSDALYVVFEATKFQNDIVTLLCRRTDGTRAEAGSRLVNCFERSPSDYNATNALQLFFLKCFDEHLKFKMAGGVVQYFHPTGEVLIKLTSLLNRGIKTADPYEILLSCELIRRSFGSGVAAEALDGKVVGAIEAPAAFPALIYEYLLTGNRVPDEVLRNICANERAVLDLGVASVVHQGSDLDPERADLFSRIFSMVNDRVFVWLMFVISKIRPGLIAALCAREDLSAYREIAAWLCRSGGSVWDEMPSHLVTTRSIEKATAEFASRTGDMHRYGERLKGYRGSIYYDSKGFVGERVKVAADNPTDIGSQTSSTDEFAVPSSLREDLLKVSVLSPTTYRDLRDTVTKLSYDIPELHIFFT